MAIQYHEETGGPWTSKSNELLTDQYMKIHWEVKSLLVKALASRALSGKVLTEKLSTDRAL